MTLFVPNKHCLIYPSFYIIDSAPFKNMLKTLIFDRKCRIGCYCLGSCGAGGALYGKNITFVLSIVVYMLYYAFLGDEDQASSLLEELGYLNFSPLFVRAV